MTKIQITESIRSLYQASHQAEFLHLQAQVESLLQELQARKQNQLAADASLANQSESNKVSLD